MTPRSRAVVVLVASTALLVGSGVAWAVVAQRGVGEQLERVTEARAATDAGVTRAPSRPRVEPPASNPQSDSAGVVLPEEIPTVDATEIVIPDPVEPPRELRLADLGVQMPVRATGVTRDGQMELPDDPDVIGWYKFGASPGDRRGSAVLGGHVDSIEQGVGPLARLASASVGDTVVVIDSDGSRLRYEVTAVRRFAKTALPVDELFRPDGPHRLAIVTCGGRFLPDAGGYEDNIVVIAAPVGR